MRNILTLVFLLLAFGELNAKSRVATETNYLLDPSGFILYDSLRFSYSGNRHSDYGFRQSADFDNLWYINRGVLFSSVYPDFLELEGTNIYDSTFTAIPQFDTIRYWSFNLSGAPLFHCVVVRSYNPDGTTRSIIRFVPSGSAGLVPTTKQDIVYNSGHISKVYHQEYSSGVWDTTAFRSLRYDAAGRVLLDSMYDHNTGAFLPHFITKYSYSSSSLPYTQKLIFGRNSSTGSFDTGARHTILYYSNAQLRRRFVESSWQSGIGFTDSWKDSFAYTSGIPGWTGYYYQMQASQTLRKCIADHVTPRNRVDSLTYYLYDPSSTTPASSFRFTYNSEDNPILYQHYSYNAPVLSPALQEYTSWTYEQYGLGISTVETLPVQVSVAPNPVTDRLIIKYSRPIADTSITVRLINVMGQLVHTWSLLPQGTNTVLTLAEEITPGLYNVQVLSHSSEVLYTGKIIKK